MNALGVCLTLAVGLYVLCYDAVLRAIFLCLLGGYYVISYRQRGAATKAQDSVWRRMRLAWWADPYSCEVLGEQRVLIEKTLAWCRSQSQATGKKITLTHALLKTMAIVMSGAPDMRGKLAFGAYTPIEENRISIFLPADNGETMKWVALDGLASKPLAAIADDVNAEARVSTCPLPSSLLLLPSAVLSLALELISLVTIQLGLRLPFLQAHSFGTSMLTNLVDIEADMLWTPLLPFSRLSIVITCSKVRREAVVVDGKVTVQDTLHLCAQLDHRFLDGMRAAALANQVKDILESPEEHFT